MRVYYFTNEEFGLSNIINERLKISLLDELNDPFEFLGVDISNDSFRRAFNAGRREVAKKAGVICFCRDWQDPLMWAHYGDKHKGICLGFDVAKEHIKEINYLPTQMTNDIDMKKEYGGKSVGQWEKMVERLLCTKYIKWKYEDEVRVVVPLEKPDDSGLFFTQFNGDMKLKEIFLGPRSKLTLEQIARHIQTYSEEVNIYKSKIAFAEYKVVLDSSLKHYTHSPCVRGNKLKPLTIRKLLPK